ncbi:MAG TPA: uroporphyrinogen-III synthase, partial [Flavobacterium sp.]|nr:uroporphyrinogen-III synthase [Flavobacterium sp.]
GSTTQKEALDHGLRIDIMAPTPGTPSMTMALEKYVAEANKGK